MTYLSKTRLMWALLTLFAILVATNNYFAPTDYLTLISAYDTKIYLTIARSVPGWPDAGANLVYHGAQRWLLPQLIGWIAMPFGVDVWMIFRMTVLASVLLTLIIFLRTLLVSTTGNTSAIIALLASLLFNPFLFRLQLGFSGFVNDAVFCASLALLTYGYVSRNRLLITIAVMIMIPVKQTVLVIVPAMLVAELFLPWTTRLRSLTYWSTFFVLAIVYYAVSHFMIMPFCIENSTATMAFGLIAWFREFQWPRSAIQMTLFFGRAGLGLLPVIALAVGILSAGRLRWKTREFFYLSMLFLGTIAQPFISGPDITDSSIQRLVGYGAVPALAALSYSMRRLQWENQILLYGSVLFLFLGSLHHVTSFVGPDFSLKQIFFTNYVIGNICFAALIRDGMKAPADTSSHARVD